MERYDFRTQRLFVNVPIKNGTSIELDRKQSNYLLNVLRLKEKAQILVFNGQDGEWFSELVQSGKKSAKLTVLERTREQPNRSNITYYFAPIKQARQDYMIQKAVEMGVGKIQPVLTHHTQVNKVKLDRMHANAIEAAEQCGVLSIAECALPIKFTKFISELDSSTPLVFCDELEASMNAISKLEKLNSNYIGVLIGPEGGFSPAERKQLLALENTIPISLGPRILRADTAAVAALAIVQTVCGDWTKKE